MLDSILSTVVGKITDAIGQRVELFLGATDELKDLSTTFRSIREVLNDADTRQVAEEPVRIWLWELKHVAYDMEDLLDKQLILSLENEASGGDDGSIVNKVLASFRGYGPRHQVAGQIKQIRKRLDRIVEDKKNYNFTSMGTGGLTGGDCAHAGESRLTTYSLVESSEVIGRDNDKDIVINQLVSEGSNSSSSHEEDGQVRVVAVVGIGGLGKTTLAQGICNDARVETHFGKILWVCVTENFDIFRVMKAILGELRENAPFPELSTLLKQLHETLKGKRFLLVLDDMWNDDEEKWKPLQLSLSSGAPGSRILVTTRIEMVANAMNAAYIHKLQGLSEDDSWKLFSSRAFARGKEEDRLKLEGIGKEIVKKCKGVPLSVKVMGSAMGSKAAVRDWQNILESKIWSLPEAKNKILPALFLSYSNLPAHLKPCFAYCSIYEKDTVMVKDKLVKLWMAQGWIQLQGNREIEDIGAEYFEDLVALSMFQEVVEGRGETRCKMHDLLHDLAQFITEDEISIFTEEKSDQCSTNVRHASLFSTDGSIPDALYRARNLRTLFLNGGLRRLNVTKLRNMFCQPRFLRVFRMSGSGIGVLTETIGKLKHLRYLDLSNSDIVELPESVTHLHVLHTLILNSCHRLRRLPSGMQRMVSLRHLEIEDTMELVCLPEGLGRLTSLRSLSKFIVGDEGECGIDELHRLNSLQGRLQIENLYRVSSREASGKAELWSKPHLRTLKLSMSSPGGYIERMGHVLEGLRPHCNLEELEISDSSASKLPVWMEDSSFSNLTRVIIKSLRHCAQLPGLGNLPALEFLSMEYVGVRKLGHEFYFGNSTGQRCDVGRRVAFPKLQQLQLIEMSKLEEWEARPLEYDNGETIMPSLSVLKLRYCPKLEALPHHLTKLKDLLVIGCKKIKGRGWCFPLLEIFHLEGSNEFFSSGLPRLPKLKKFQIYEINNEMLTDEGWEQLESLEELRFHDCRRLESLPDGLGQLKALKSLEMQYLVALTCLPRGLGQLQSLETLVIKACPKLQSLPDGVAQLKALQSLEIYQCEALGSLPRGLRDLPLPPKSED